ncbi:MAG: class I SAM-dependent methyltransferase [Thermoplasmata archaeon]|nr:class I SAM-dependent methyltransferase [Thermoplasmata archaeon]
MARTDWDGEWRRLPNLRRVKVAFHYPDLALLFLAGRTSLEDFVRRMIQRDLAVIRRRYARQDQRAQSLLTMSAAQAQEFTQDLFPSAPGFSGRMFNGLYSFLYAATRALRPDVVVETGVFYGSSSAAILQALEDNGTGELHSVDLPPARPRETSADARKIRSEPRSRTLELGFAVPLALRRRWHLHLGNSLDVLPALLGTVGPLSMFIHDSLHTYEHMMAEYRLAYPALKQGGLLVSDDIGYHSAWAEFCQATQEQGILLTKAAHWGPFGYLVKSR